MKILVFGKSGQVASSLASLNSPDLVVETKGRNEVDLLSNASIEEALTSSSPDVVINAAAYTAVDKAEDEPERANLLNNVAVANIASAASNLNIPLVHISTDYVFDGSGTSGWKPSDKPNPIGIYGQTKLAGEKALLDNHSNAVVLRTSWVFSQHGANFVKTMLRLGVEKGELNIVCDQIGGPTSANDIARAVVSIAKQLKRDQSLNGVWHYSGRDDCSWADFAKEIFKQANIACSVNPIPSSDYPTRATRPLNSRLDCTATETRFGIERPDWKASLGKVLEQLEWSNERS